MFWSSRVEELEAEPLPTELGGHHTAYLNQQLQSKTALKKQREISKKIIRGDPPLLKLFQEAMDKDRGFLKGTWGLKVPGVQFFRVPEALGYPGLKDTWGLRIPGA